METPEINENCLYVQNDPDRRKIELAPSFTNFEKDQANTLPNMQVCTIFYFTTHS